MGKPSNSTVTQTQQPNPQFQAAYQSAVSNAQNLASQPYQQYQGSLLAPINANQQTGIDQIYNSANYAAPYIANAWNDFNSSATPITATPFSTSAVNQYLSPYTQDVTSSLQNLFNQQNATQLSQVAGNAAAQGAFGGDREAVAAAQTAGQQQAQEAPVLASTLQQGYNTALGEFNAQQQANLQAQQATGWLQQGAGYGTANLGQERQNEAISGGQSLINAGTLQQQQQQEALNIPYEQFIAQQSYPYQMAGWEANIAEGLGSAAGGTSSTQYPGPSALSQVAGLGLAGTGILGATGAFGSSGYLTGSNGLLSGLFGSSAGGSFDPTLAAGAADADFSGGVSAAGSLLGDAAALKTGGRIHRQGGGALTSPYEGISVPGMASPNASSSGQTASPVPQLPNLSTGYIPTPPTMGGGRSMMPSGAGMQQPQQQQPVIQALQTLQTLKGLKGLFPGDSADTPAAATGGAVSLATPYQGFDDGGQVQQAGQALTGGQSPLTQGMLQQYLQLPLEQLQELAQRSPPSTPQGQTIQRALQIKHMNPGTGISGAGAPQPPASPQGLAAVPSPVGPATSGMSPVLAASWTGGRIHRQEGGDIPGLSISPDSPFAQPASPDLNIPGVSVTTTPNANVLTQTGDEPAKPAATLAAPAAATQPSASLATPPSTPTSQVLQGHQQTSLSTPPSRSSGQSSSSSPGAVPEGLVQSILSSEGSRDESVSPKGAVGKFQVMPSTGAPYMKSGESLFDPVVNNRVGRSIINDLWHRYDGNPLAVKVAYNAGPGVADRWLASGQDPSVLPAETQHYIGVSGGSKPTLASGPLGVGAGNGPALTAPLTQDASNQGGSNGLTLADISKLMSAPHTPTGDFYSSPWMPLISAGAGMLASRSPFPGVALGEGLETGLKELGSQQAAIPENELRQSQAQAAQLQTAMLPLQMQALAGGTSTGAPSSLQPSLIASGAAGPGTARAPNGTSPGTAPSAPPGAAGPPMVPGVVQGAGGMPVPQNLGQSPQFAGLDQQYQEIGARIAQLRRIIPLYPQHAPELTASLASQMDNYTKLMLGDPRMQAQTEAMKDWAAVQPKAAQAGAEAAAKMHYTLTAARPGSYMYQGDQVIGATPTVRKVIDPVTGAESEEFMPPPLPGQQSAQTTDASAATAGAGPPADNGALGKAWQTELGPGQRVALEDRAKIEQAGRDETLKEAQAAQNQQSTLNVLKDNAAHMYTGPGSSYVGDFNRIARLINPAYDDTVEARESFMKNGGQLIRQATRELSPRAAFQELRFVESTLPNPDMSPKGLNSVIGELQGLNDYKIAKAQAQSQWEMQHGGVGHVEGFESDWQANAHVTPYTFIISRMAQPERQQLFATWAKTDEGRAQLQRFAQERQYAVAQGWGQ